MKKITATLLAALLCVSLVACGTSEGSKDYTTRTGFAEVVGKKNLYYDPDTKIVYIIFNETDIGYQGYGYMSPYYAPNGLPYIYDPYSQALLEIKGANMYED